MQAGSLNEIIELYKPELDTNTFGEQVQHYLKVNECRAQVINKSGTRENSNNEIFYEYLKTFKVRLYQQLNENYQIGYRGKRYRILSIEDNRKFNEKIIETQLINE